MVKGSYQEVILRQAVQKLGREGDVVRVKPGYARNHLIPRGLAVMATPGNLQMLQMEKQQAMIRNRKEREDAKKVAENLKTLSFTASVQTGEEDRVFGSVTAMTISTLLKEHGYDIDKKAILLNEPIKALGLYYVPVKIYGDIEVDIKVYVIKE